VTLDVLALGPMIPVLPRIVPGFMGGDTAAGRDVRRLLDRLGADAVVLLALLGVVSDRYGRRPALLVSCLGSGSTTCSWQRRPRLPCCSSAG